MNDIQCGIFLELNLQVNNSTSSIRIYRLTIFNVRVTLKIIESRSYGAKFALDKFGVWVWADYASGFLRPVARRGQRGLLIVIIPSKYVHSLPLAEAPSYTLPGSIVLARMAPCATSMKLSVPPFLPKTRLFCQEPSLRTCPRLVLRPSPAGVSSALNFSKIIAASSPLNRRDNRGIASRRVASCRASCRVVPNRGDWWLRSLARARNAKRNYILSKVLSHPRQLPSQRVHPLPRVVSLVTRSVICYLSVTKLSIVRVSRDM